MAAYDQNSMQGHYTFNRKIKVIRTGQLVIEVVIIKHANYLSNLNLDNLLWQLFVAQNIDINLKHFLQDA